MMPSTPSGSRSISTAPAPSPKRMQVLRSVMSMMDVMTSVPMSRAFFTAPVSIWARTVCSAKRKPLQAADRSYPQAFLQPSARWMMQAVLGNIMSGVTVGTTMRSISSGATPAISMA